MWYLREEPDESKPPSEQQPRPHYWLGGVQGGGRTIGRKHVDIRLKASSVSRTHARINVLKAAFYSPSSYSGRRRHHSTCVSVQDSSAYGTFLKYPPGHASNRSEQAIGHHHRLDKDTPTEVCEGAFLAFGAPSAWWRLGWQHIVLVPSRISVPERNRILLIAGQTSVEVADVWGEDSTHLVTHQCISSSIRFLTVLAEGKFVVTPAWVEALRHTVTEACRAITEAANKEAIMAACTLADEKRCIPPFCPADQAVFTVEELNAVFETAVKERRIGLFKGILFAFTREERRARWVAVIETLDGSTILSKAVNQAATTDRIVFIQGEQGASKKGQEEVPGRAYVQEAALSAAIIRANLSSLEVASSPVKPAVAEITDVATPGPLDSESEAETDDSEPSGQTKRETTGQDAAVDVEEAIVDVDGVATVTQQVSRSFAVPKTNSRLPTTGDVKKVGVRDPSRSVGFTTTPKKRARAASGVSSEERLGPRAAKRPAIDVSERAPDDVEKNAVMPAAEVTPVDNSDVNERAFFTVEEMPSNTDVAQGKRVRKGRTMSSRDVRPFRRRNLPDASTIPLKRVRCVESTESGFDRAQPQVEPRSRGRAGSSGAQVIESEEE